MTPSDSLARRLILNHVHATSRLPLLDDIEAMNIVDELHVAGLIESNRLGAERERWWLTPAGLTELCQ
jgi:hypothetical protein